jgi:HD-GYP domain-containing protein (c-di-GMP phosphodiesterase class II)
VSLVQFTELFEIGSESSLLTTMDEESKREITDLIDGLCRIVAHRDVAAAVHLEATSALSERLAREMELPPDVVFRASVAGRVHDLGMLAVPSRITSKAGPPDRLERDELEMHPIYGASILDGFARLEQFSEIVRAHHERVDGKGYPNQLAHYDIPLEAKIVGVAEAFHAMTTDRPFSAARTPQRALAEIYRCRDSQFDTTVVNTLCRLMRWDPAAAEETQQAS